MYVEFICYFVNYDVGKVILYNILCYTCTCSRCI